MSSLPEIFSPEGPLARAISGYRIREQQLDMAERIAAAIKGCSVFIAEAGTGTGKTFAYLVPALQSNGKVIHASPFFVDINIRPKRTVIFNRAHMEDDGIMELPIDSITAVGRGSK